MPSAKLKTKPKPNSWRFNSLGTAWSIDLFEEISDLAIIKKAVHDRLEEFDKTYSRFRADSIVTQASEKAGEYRLPNDSRKLFEFYESLYKATHGIVTPLIGDLISAAGYDANYSFKEKILKSPFDWSEAIKYEANKLTVIQPTLLDFGAAGKGYAVDLVAELLQAKGISQFSIDAGGDMVVRGNETMQVGLENPDNLDQVVGIVSLHNKAIAGSAGNRRKWANYHHIMNPTTLQSTTEIKATWVVAESTMLADGLATALFFVEPERLCQFEFDYFIINAKNQFKHSPAFPVQTFN